MTMYMPPMSMKRRSENAPASGLEASRRVFGNYDEKNNTTKTSHYGTAFKGERRSGSQPKPRLNKDTRHNNPHPDGVGFLLQDCATLHDPICDVKTKVSPGDTHWWPSRANENTNNKPVFTKDSTSRNDYKIHRQRPKGQTRHGSNPHTMAAHGAVPVTQMAHPNGPRLLMERISYQHGYDSRSANNQPQRGKLHGNFVWDALHPTKPDAADAIPSPRGMLPGRGSDGMRNIMTHDLISDSNQQVRHARFPTNKKPLQPITSKIGRTEREVLRTTAQVEGVRYDTVPSLPPIAS